MSKPTDLRLKADYYCEPSAEEIRRRGYVVSRLRIGRRDHGWVEWEGDIDVRGLNFSEDIVIERSGSNVIVEIHPHGEWPEPGQKFNRKALLCIVVRPNRQITPENRNRFEAMLKRTAEDWVPGGRFESYDMTTNEWKFTVPHFRQRGH